ncbi:MAG: transcription termination/antitermination protein NusA [Candidatus Eisenbacteria bacterium]|nr:transcription termination/antitermination protein NusA [Candidatus Eisenbacteria bacterium]
MNTGVLEALRRMAREKQLDQALLMEALEAGLLSAARKKYGLEAGVEVVVDDKHDTLGVYLKKAVVEETDDDVMEIELDEAREIDPSATVGDTVRVEVPFDEFGRNAVQAAKQIVVQRVREAEREQIYDEYQDRIGEIVTGDVQQIERGGIVVNLGRTEALLPAREQIRRERYRQGDRVRAYLLSVEKTTKGPQIILSRTQPNFLKKLFRMEVPEIYDSVVEIMAIAREAGGRSKVAVASHDERVDPVGACVGVKGSRIQTIVRELSGEKIDIVPWSSDPSVLVSRALNPAKVSKAILNDAEHSVRVIVPDDQLSLAIGKGGQNARLAAKLTGWKIDIVGETEHARDLEIGLAQRVGVGELPGVGPKLAAALAVAGYRYVRDLDGVTTEDLLKVPGVGEKTAEKISISVAAVLEVLEEEKQEMLREMEERARAEAMRRAEAQEPRYDAEPSEPGEADAEGEEPEEGAEEGDDAAPADASDEGAVEQGEAAATEGEAQPEER